MFVIFRMSWISFCFSNASNCWKLFFLFMHRWISLYIFNFTAHMSWRALLYYSFRTAYFRLWFQRVLVNLVWSCWNYRLKKLIRVLFLLFLRRVAGRLCFCNLPFIFFSDLIYLVHINGKRVLHPSESLL